MIRTERIRRAAVWVVLPAVAYLAAALIMSWPLGIHLTTHIPGGSNSDAYMMMRQAWDAHEQLRAGKNPLEQTRLAYPEHYTSRMMWSTPLRWVPQTLLMFVFKPVLAFNLWLLVILVLNGLTAYWLAMALTRQNSLAALLGGLVFMSAPVMQGHLAAVQVDVLSLYGLPLFALCWWRVLFAPDDQRGGWRSVIAGGGWLALASLGLTSIVIYAVMPVVVFSGLYLLLSEPGRLVRRGEPWHVQPWLRAGAMLVVGGLILLIFFAPLMTAAGQNELGQMENSGMILFHPSLVGFFVPSSHGLWKNVPLINILAKAVTWGSTAERTAYLGVVASQLVFLGWWMRGKDSQQRYSSRMWLAIALGAMVLSLGSFLEILNQPPVNVQIEGIRSHIVMPWGLLQNLPVARELRTAGRFNLATALAWGMLVSLGAAAILPHVRRQAVRIGAGVIIGALILMDYQAYAPFPESSAAQPDYLRELAARDDVRAVLDVPTDYWPEMAGMGAQMAHGKPLVTGSVYRNTRQNPALLWLVDTAVISPYGDAPALPLDSITPLLQATGADRLFIHKEPLESPESVVARVTSALGEPPEYEDEQLAAFVIPQQVAPPPADFFAWASKFGNWSMWQDYGEFSGYWLARSGEWGIYTTTPSGELVIPTRVSLPGYRVTVWLDDQQIGTWEITDDDLRLPVQATPGFHRLRFESLDGCTLYPFDLACLDNPSSAPCPRADQPICISVAFGAPTWVVEP
jgi:hypothetical protein